MKKPHDLKTVFLALFSVIIFGLAYGVWQGPTVFLQVFQIALTVLVQLLGVLLQMPPVSAVVL